MRYFDAQSASHSGDDLRFASDRRRAVMWVQVFRSIELPTQFLLGFLAARALSPSDYGVVGLLTSVQTLAVVVISAGYDETTQKSIASIPASAIRVLKRSAHIRLFASIVFCVIVACTLCALIGVGFLRESAVSITIWLVLYTVSTAFAALILAASLAVYRPAFCVFSSFLSWVPAILYFLSADRPSIGGYFFWLTIG